MNIYVLERIGDTDYDEAAGYVVVAPDVARARELVSGQATGWEGGASSILCGDGP